MYLRQVSLRLEIAYSSSQQQQNFCQRPSPMKNPFDVLRVKEQELLRVRKEMDALRIAARLLGAEDLGASTSEAQPKMQRVVEMP